MSEIWKQWIGLSVDDRFPLRQYLAHTEHSAVFLTDYADTENGKAAIKFISADTPGAEKQLTYWSHIAQLRHPGLLPIYHTGRCRITDMDLLYVVMEFAEENLAQILPQRPLSLEEAQQMLDPVVDALVYLHGKGLAHGHIKPSNILAAGDYLKLASDTVIPIGDPRAAQRDSDVYDAPENAAAPIEAASDIWSLGQTLVETLTQQTAALPFNDNEDPALPEAIPQPFQEIARRSLRRNPRDRWSSSEIAARLGPQVVPNPDPAPAPPPAYEPIAVAVAAGATASQASPSQTPSSVQFEPLNVPLSREPAVPLSRLPVTPPPTTSYPRAQKPSPRISPPPSERDFVLPNYVVPILLAGTIILIAVLALPRLFRHQPALGSATTSAKNTSSVTTPSHRTEAPRPKQEVAPPAASPTPKPPADSTNATPSTARPASPVASSNVEAKTPASAATPSPASQNSGDVLNQVLPTPSKQALNTIRGTVRVTVRAHVDPAGRVSNADLEAAGPSRYFAQQALQAAKEWEFASPENNGHSVPSEWLIRFEFSPDGTKAYPSQTTP
ncbi:MAG: TonB family protein [Candidatus Acidiferrum sp.]